MILLSTASKSVFKEKWIQDLQQQIFEHLRANVDWIGIDQAPNTSDRAPRKMLDYACGNGLPSQVGLPFSKAIALALIYHPQALVPYFSTCIGMDISEGMVEKYNSVAAEQKLSPEQMHAVHGDLIRPNVDPALLSDDLSNFDLVAICMALHHLEDPVHAVKRLVERLRFGGTLLVIDWATRPEADHTQRKRAQEGPGGEKDDAGTGSHHHDHGPQRYPAAHTVAHDSFAREQMVEAFEKAGCDGVDFVLHPKPSVVPMATGGQMQLFFAKCTRRWK